MTLLDTYPRKNILHFYFLKQNIDWYVWVGYIFDTSGYNFKSLSLFITNVFVSSGYSFMLNWRKYFLHSFSEDTINIQQHCPTLLMCFHVVMHKPKDPALSTGTNYAGKEVFGIHLSFVYIVCVKRKLKNHS